MVYGQRRGEGGLKRGKEIAGNHYKGVEGGWRLDSRQTKIVRGLSPRARTLATQDYKMSKIEHFSRSINGSSTVFQLEST